ncbi:MAG TPA: alpha/beta hydrolase-fold protein [Candidatus Binatia bacterium]|nr:alpha/beta hydrolase-fold protein [Candidatus Binatia bacterium]
MRRVGAAARAHAALISAAAAAALTGLSGWLAGPSLQSWFVAMGMDAERGALLASVVLVTLATAVVAALSRQSGATRLGGLAGFVGIQVVPFLIRAATTPPTPGLHATADILGWVLQPLGMLLLAALAVVIGAALGTGLVRDLSRLRALLGRRRLWPAVPAAAAILVIAGMAASTALQDGPLSALVDYGASAPTASSTTRPDSPSSSPQTGTSQAETPVPTPDLTALRQLPGRIQSVVIGGRLVVVYVPGIYDADPSLRLPVLYLLHGSPGDPEEWLGNGGQLQGVLDQLIGAGTVPPLLVVMPDGNGTNSQDTEWGDVANGDIESWLVDQVVPAVDGQFRTLGYSYQGIAGLSSGGFGAMNLAFRHPTVFSWAGSYSGYFTARENIFGSKTAANSPLDTAARVPVADRMPIYLGYGADDGISAGTNQFASVLKNLGWPKVNVQEVPGGHGWEAWRAEVVNSLTWLGQLWGAQPWAPVTSRVTG